MHAFILWHWFDPNDGIVIKHEAEYFSCKTYQELVDHINKSSGTDRICVQIQFK